MKEEETGETKTSSNKDFCDDTYISSFTILLKNNPYLIKHDNIISLSPHEPTVWSRVLSDKSMLDECISGTMITGPYVECSGKTLDESRFRMLIKNGKTRCPAAPDDRHRHHEEEILPGGHKSQLSLFISEMKSMASHGEHGYFGVHDVTELAHGTESTLHSLHHGLEKGHLAPLLMKSVGDCLPVVGTIIGTTEVIEHGENAYTSFKNDNIGEGLLDLTQGAGSLGIVGCSVSCLFFPEIAGYYVLYSLGFMLVNAGISVVRGMYSTAINVDLKPKNFQQACKLLGFRNRVPVTIESATAACHHLKILLEKPEFKDLAEKEHKITIKSFVEAADESLNIIIATLSRNRVLNRSLTNE